MKRFNRRGRTVLRCLALVLAAAAVALVVTARRPDNAAAAPASAPAPALRTPLWSPRRVPVLFADDAARARLTRELTRAVAGVDACVAVDDATGPLARVGGDKALAPASTTKLITATAALSVLGPDTRLTTRAFQAPNGDLILVGGGDPMLATANFIAHQHASARFRDVPYTDLAKLADAIAASGVKSVNAVVVDDRRHDSQRFLPDWKPNYIPDGELGALGALAVDSGFADPIGRRTSDDPAVLTGERLAPLLAARGVGVRGGVTHGVAPDGSREIAHVDSPTIAEIVKEMLVASDDYTSELLMREIGVGVARGQPATTGMGIAVTMQTLARLGIPFPGTELHDGSGLAPNDRVACPTLVAIIDRMKQSTLTAIDRGLPVAGKTGTLAPRFVGDPLAGKLRAKTGSIDNVVGLAGTIDSSTSPRFAFIANGNFSTAGGAALQDVVAHVVASYPQRIDAGALVPAP